MWNLFKSRQYQKDEDRLKNERKRLDKMEEELKKDPKHGNNVKKLTNRDDYRYRIGPHRILYDINEEEKEVNLNKIASRGQAYKD